MLISELTRHLDCLNYWLILFLHPAWKCTADKVTHDFSHSEQLLYPPEMSWLKMSSSMHDLISSEHVDLLFGICRLDISDCNFQINKRKSIYHIMQANFAEVVGGRVEWVPLTVFVFGAGCRGPGAGSQWLVMLFALWQAWHTWGNLHQGSLQPLGEEYIKA